MAPRVALAYRWFPREDLEHARALLGPEAECLSDDDVALLWLQANAVARVVLSLCEDGVELWYA